MKLERQQVIGSLVRALVVLAILLVRVWPVTFPK
jgi:hypothetical protein